MEKTLESPLDCKEIQPVHPKGDQSWAFIGKTDVEAETPKLWPPDVITDSLEKTLMLGKIEGERKRGRQRMRWLDGITTQRTWVWVNSRSWWWTGRPVMMQSMGSQRVRHNWGTELNWTCHTSTWVSHGCTCVPHPEPPSQLPPHPIPLGCPSSLALSALFHALNLDWSSISHMVIYVSVLFSEIIPPSPSPTGSKRLFLISVSLLLSQV